MKGGTITFYGACPMSIVDLFAEGEGFFTFELGQIIFEKGDPSDYMYAIVDGEVEILFDGKILDTIGKGAVFGEMALIEDAPRSATAKAKSDCTVAQVDKGRFHKLIQQNPAFALEVMKIMSERLRRMMEIKAGAFPPKKDSQEPA